MTRLIHGALAVCLLLGCDSDPESDAGPAPNMDAGFDAGSDAGFDAGEFDADARNVVGVWFEPVALPDGVDVLTASAFLPDGTMLATSHPGIVHHLQIDGTTATELGQFSIADSDFTNSGDCGLLQIAIDPSWETNGFVFLGHCGANTESVVRRVTFDGSSYDGIVDTSAEILRVEGPRMPANNHSVGGIGFDDDGVMFVVIGDKASEDGQRTDQLLSSLLRIIPNRDAGGSGYEPAPGNAFDGSGVDRPETYAWGLRYGWRAVRDPMGRYWVGDVGEGVAEEVNLVTEAGQNFGWSTCEGACDPSDPTLVDPITFWRRDDASHPYFVQDPMSEPTSRRVVWVGDVYDPSGEDRYNGFLTERVPFGDNCLGWVRGAWADASGALSYDEHWAHLPHITSWEQASDGFVYVTTFGSCDAFDPFDPAALYRVMPDYE